MPMRPVLALAAGVLIAALSCGQAAAADDPAFAVRQTVLDIISFTRWPAPPPALRLCVIGQAEFATPLFADDMRVAGTQVTAVRKAASDTGLGMDCDVLYVGPLPAASRADVVRSIAGFPVLTIGEAAPGCIETTMFCLQAGGVPVPFSTNLDAIARSGVRLNPRVLLLGRHAPVPPTVPK